MGFDEFFTDGDKPYAENLNDSLALIDAFDVTVPAEMPGMFSNGEFNSTVNVTRKCGVALVTLKSVDSGVTVGTSSISGTGDVVFRVYPNFNSFYKWSKIIIDGSGTVEISFKKIDGTSISATVGSDGTISEASALKQLQEIDVVLSLTSATINSILIEFINNQTSRTRTGALLEASQLVNVDGIVEADDLRAVSGDTVNTALEGLSTTIDTALDGKEDVSNKVNTLDSSTSNYPSCSAVKSVTDNKADSNNVYSKSEMNTLLNGKSNTNHTHHTAWDEYDTDTHKWCSNSILGLYEIYFSKVYTFITAELNTWVDIGSANTYPRDTVYIPTIHSNIAVRVTTTGTIQARSTQTGQYNIVFHAMWHY